MNRSLHKTTNAHRKSEFLLKDLDMYHAVHRFYYNESSNELQYFYCICKESHMVFGEEKQI